MGPFGGCSGRTITAWRHGTGPKRRVRFRSGPAPTTGEVISSVTNADASTADFRFMLLDGWSETVARPDLREITDASYIDPIADDLVDGNPGVIPSDVANYDIRAELFLANGDNLTVSGFHKDTVNPIEFERPCKAAR